MRITKDRLSQIILEEAASLEQAHSPEADTVYQKVPNSEKYDNYFGNDLTLGNIRAIVQETIEEQIKNEFKRVYERLATLEQALDKSNVEPSKAPMEPTEEPTGEPSRPASPGEVAADTWQMRANKDNAIFPLSTAPDYEKQIAALKAKYSKGAK